MPRNVLAAGVVSFFTDVSSEMIVPVLPLFLTGTLGASASVVGLIEGVAESTASLLRVFAGWISDRTGRRKPLILLGYTLSNLAKPLFALATAWPQVLAVRFADRFGKGIRGAPRDALIADSVDPSIRGRAFGFHRSMDTAGAALGPLLAAAVLALSANNPRAVFWLAALPGLAAILTAWLLLRDRPAPPRDAAAPRLGFRGLGRPFALFTAVSTLFAVGNSSDAFLILRAQDVGMAAWLIPIAYFAFNALFAALATPAGILSDRVGRRVLLVVGYALFAAVYLGFALAGDALAVGGLFLLYAVYYALTEGIARALITDLVPASLRATALGTHATATGLALLPASTVAGLLWTAVAPWAPFAYGAATAALAALLLVFLPLRVDLERQGVA
ncbi:MAG TPA: MFS transporter [Chloroflexota bacterium]|jgi:MFS family permease|nr:MFS transporter [Chloroflexota bacterium]